MKSIILFSAMLFLFSFAPHKAEVAETKSCCVTVCCTTCTCGDCASGCATCADCASCCE